MSPPSPPHSSLACTHTVLTPRPHPHPLNCRYLDVDAAPAFGKSAFLPQAAAVLVAGAALSFDVPFALFIQTLAFVALNKVYDWPPTPRSLHRFLPSAPPPPPPSTSYTVQYFVWFFSFLPLALARLPLHSSPRPRALLPSLVFAGTQNVCSVLRLLPVCDRVHRAVAAWAAAQGLWLSQAYLLEFKGDTAHYRVTPCCVHVSCLCCCLYIDGLQVWLCSLALLGAHTLLALVFLFWHRGAGKAPKNKL